MATEKFTPQPRAVPLGAILLPDLLWRYLPAVGIDGRFKPPLTDGEVRQYALRALIKVTEKYAKDSFSKEDLATRVLLGDPHDKVCLLPDTDEAREYRSKCETPTILLHGRDNAIQTVRTAFINLISGEREPDEHQLKIKQEVRAESRPARRRHQPIKMKDGLSGDENLQSLENFTTKAPQQLRLEIRSILTALFARMSARDVTIIKLYFINRYTADEISAMLAVSAPTVRRTISIFRIEFKKAWNEKGSSSA